LRGVYIDILAPAQLVRLALLAMMGIRKHYTRMNGLKTPAGHPAKRRSGDHFIAAGAVLAAGASSARWRGLGGLWERGRAKKRRVA